MDRPLRRIHGIVCIMYIADAFFSLYDEPGVSLTENNPASRFLWILLIVSSLLLALPRPVRTSRMFFNNLALTGFVLLTVASSAWSILPGTTFRRAVLAVFTLQFASHLRANFEKAEVWEMLRTALRWSLLLSVLVCLVRPDIGVDSQYHVGQWRGLFPHKNSLGRAAALLGSLTLGHWLSGGKGRFKIGLDMMLCLGLMVLAFSRTGLASFLGVAAVLVVLRMLQNTKGHDRWLAASAIPIATGVILIVSGLMLSLLPSNLYEDKLLTGRIPLWYTLTLMALERPLQGYGYGQTILSPAGHGLEIWARVGWEMGSAHNAMLQVQLDLGLVGLACYLLVWLTIFARVGRNLTRPSSLVEIGVCLMVFVNGLTEIGSAALSTLWGLAFILLALSDRQVTPEGVPGAAPPSASLADREGREE